MRRAMLEAGEHKLPHAHNELLYAEENYSRQSTEDSRLIRDQAIVRKNCLEQLVTALQKRREDDEKQTEVRINYSIKQLLQYRQETSHQFGYRIVRLVCITTPRILHGSTCLGLISYTGIAACSTQHLFQFTRHCSRYDGMILLS